MIVTKHIVQHSAPASLEQTLVVVVPASREQALEVVVVGKAVAEAYAWAQAPSLPTSSTPLHVLALPSALRTHQQTFASWHASHQYNVPLANLNEFHADTIHNVICYNLDEHTQMSETQ